MANNNLMKNITYLLMLFISIISCKEEKKNYTRREYSYNSFSRSFTLPDNSSPDKINAKYENGVLNITLPKKEVNVSKPVKEIKVS